MTDDSRTAPAPVAPPAPATMAPPEPTVQDPTTDPEAGTSAPAQLPPDDPTVPSPRGRLLPAARPPEQFVAVRRWVLAGAAELRALRGELREQLAAATSDGTRTLGDIEEKVVLVASELATNALAHGEPPTQVRLWQHGHDFLLDVTDSDLTHHPHLAEGRGPGEGGFGLQIARRLSLDVGWYTESGLKHVWATFSGPRRR
ncbi:ATP-binding protein [Cellulomonas oligotrophica]|uniref:Anti-sigma regulatory factor (Ser/Thr protein kinase) n=1 Tax=Cellulomonas oligotrophica TaxID=931536 RepID=A0A7Y9JX92_9CELL|nr:ATP-binding protein [Cellulomonas oligotrophica]NYD86463.1 anti-sigma regulatory factor (Ser/Thr protein kinase) [Cellulomonas oligotrophica]GIG32646.1 hypothetical protein Col01nite_18050 [Cellulomonas oligotrophica]